MLWPFVMAIIVLIVFWLEWRYRNKRLLEMSDKFPGPKTLPLLGNALKFMCKPEVQMLMIKNLITEYGDTLRFWLGPDLNFIVSNPEDVKDLLTNPKINYKGPQYKYMKDILGGGILSGSGPKWRHHRKLATPNYGKQAVESYNNVINEEIDVTLELFKYIPRDQTVDIYHYVVRITTFSVCRALMGLTRAQTEQLPHLQNIITRSPRIYDIMFNRMTKWYLQIDPIFWFSSLYREQKGLITMFKEFSKGIINQSKMKLQANKSVNDTDFKNSETKTDLSVIDRFVLSEVMSEDELWQETFTIFTSSQEAAAKITSFLLLMMAYHPECQETLYAEIKRVIGEEDTWVNGKDFDHMPYLDMVFKEIIRLFPTGAMLQRSIREDITISSGTLPAGSSVVFSIYHIHRDPRFWTDPEAFDPERFSPENSKLRDPNCFIPFSLGPMDCLGRYFCANLVKTICVRILRDYKLSSLQTYSDLKLYIAISAKSLSGYHVMLNPRK